MQRKNLKTSNEGRRKQAAATKRENARRQTIKNARRQTIQNAREDKKRLDAMGFYRKQTFIDIVSNVTLIDPDTLNKHIHFSGSPGKHTKITLNLVNSIPKWSCLLFFQYIDMVHDNGSRSTALESWEKFCDMVLGSRFFVAEDVHNAREFVRREIVSLIASKACKEQYLSCVSDMYPPHEESYFFHNVLRIMIVHSHYSRKDGKPRLYSKPDERGTIVNVLRFVSKFYDRGFQIRKKNVQVRVNGRELLSLDMTNGGRLKDFTASYHKYLHVVNFGDKGKFFLPERDIELIIKQIIRRDDSIINKTLFNNTENIRTVNNNLPNNSRSNNKAAHTVHYNDNPLKLSVGSLNVYVFNNVPENPSNNILTKVKQMLEPNIVYRNERNGVFVEDNFRAAKSENIDKNTSGETYANLLSKHMGDFLNGVNSIHNNVVFASGDSLACVGYLISVALIPGAISRLLWEDATNDQIWLVSTTGSDVDHFRKTVSTAVEVPSALPVQPMTLPVKTDVIEDDFLNWQLEEEKAIFGRLENIAKLPLLPNQNQNQNGTLNPLPSSQTELNWVPFGNQIPLKYLFR
jgi:hypothetical protein